MAMSRIKGPCANKELVGSGGNRLRGLSRAFKKMERERKREQDLRQDRHETCLDLDEASS